MIVLAGASASGKTEVAKMLAKKYGITKVITTTTRDMRVGEVNGKDYFFVTKEQFLKMIEEDKFVEYTIYNGNYYGSTKDQIAPNRCVVIDPAGLKAYISLNDRNIVTFFLDSNEEIRHQRMIERGDLEEKIISRLEHDRKAFDVKNIPPVDFHINCETTSIEQEADKIYKLYLKEIEKRFPKK